MIGSYKVERIFYGLVDIPTEFEEKFTRTVKYPTTVWLDDTIVVTRGNTENHFTKHFSMLQKLQQNGYRATAKKSGPFRNEATCLGDEINEQGKNRG